MPVIALLIHQSIYFQYTANRLNPNHVGIENHVLFKQLSDTANKAHHLINANYSNGRDKPNYSVDPIDSLVRRDLCPQSQQILTNQQENSAKFTLNTSTKNQTINAGETIQYDFSSKSKQGFKGALQLSVVSSLPQVALSKNQIIAGESFTIDVPTRITTQPGNYVFTVTATNAEQLQQFTVNLEVLPEKVKLFTISNKEVIKISDNDNSGIQSSIFVPYHVKIFSLDIAVAINHSWPSDLTMNLISPSGHKYKLQNTGNDSTNTVFQHFPIDNVKGINAYGTWKLDVIDNASGNIGKLNQWRINLRGSSLNEKPPHLIKLRE